MTNSINKKVVDIPFFVVIITLRLHFGRKSS
uniref:Uncharacterized protein n=1 Tax=Arundo donax TaxID=35708 RepID=A0A0A9CCK1_ARUDO